MYQKGGWRLAWVVLEHISGHQQATGGGVRDIGTKGLRRGAGAEGGGEWS